MVFDVIIGRNETDMKKFGKEGTIFLGRSYVKMGQYTSLSNNIHMDVLRSHVIYVAGKRGSGKSYSIGVIAEGMSLLPKKVSKNIACIILDTMGIFWTMKYENEKDLELLNEWKLNPKKVNVKIYTPQGYFEKYKKEGIPTDFSFSIAPKELTAEDWRLAFELEKNNPASIIIEKVINDLKEKEADFSIDDIIRSIKKESLNKETKMAALNMFENVQNWGLFSEESTPMKDILKGGEISVVDISCYSSGKGGWGVKSLVTGLLCKKIFMERMESRKEEEYETIETGESLFGETSEKEWLPQAWIFIDEAHEFLPKKGKTAATEALIAILREGRQPGVSLVLATQQPGKIHGDVMTQSDIVISHIVTSKSDVEALNSMNQSYLVSDLVTYLNNLPKEKGAGLILDDNSERIYPMKIRPRFTWHGGESPIALKKEKKFELDF